jgi:hypothetical protein
LDIQEVFMNRLLNIFIAAAFASLSTGALAKDDGVEGVRDQAKDTYKMDKKACTPLQGQERKNCLHRAKAQYDQATADAKRMKAEQKEEKAAKRAEKRDAKKRAKVHSGGDRSYKDGASAGSQRPAAGAQSAGEASAEPAPGKGMGRAPVTAGGSTKH